MPKIERVCHKILCYFGKHSPILTYKDGITCYWCKTKYILKTEVKRLQDELKKKG